MATLLEMHGLSKSFGGVIATDNVDLAIEAGEIHAVIGPNGAGKTTLINQISGSLRPDSGDIRLDGRAIAAKPAHVRARLGITRSFQITTLIMGMTVLENVMLAVQARDGHSFRFLKAQRKVAHLREAAHAVLEQVGLGARADSPTSELSHGEHRLMEIALALAAQARLMLLDEPMAGLGGEESKRMVAFLKTLKGKHTILLIEHDMDAVFQLADRISVLVYGRIIATGTPDEIRASAEVRHAYLGED